ncbi:MotA/TolQ/ExbB proton channel family protein [bacterium]|nr:MotA/TolQ/ExbB proton channel family protein [bacterium]
MLTLFKGAGIWGYFLLFLLALILFQIIRRAMALSKPLGDEESDAEHGIHSILFWGGFSALLGIYGQITGLYHALGAIIAATEIAPKLILQGLSESFTSTLFGMSNLILAALAWHLLMRAHRRRLKS